MIDLSYMYVGHLALVYKEEGENTEVSYKGQLIRTNSMSFQYIHGTHGTPKFTHMDSIHFLWHFLWNYFPCPLLPLLSHTSLFW